MFQRPLYLLKIDYLHAVTQSRTTSLTNVVDVRSVFKKNLHHLRTRASRIAPHTDSGEHRVWI